MQRSANFVQIDPDRALCWESENRLRVGFDRVLAQVAAPPGAAQRLLGALIAGVDDDELVEPALSIKHGKSGAELLDQLRPALVMRTRSPSAQQAKPASSSIRASMSDDGREVPGLRTALEANWLCHFERGPAPPELAIQVLRFLEPLERTRRWLSDRVPHLLIRFTDDVVRIGPLVSGSGSPCHCCEVLALLDVDPGLPALAAQLYGSIPGTESPIVSSLAGAIAANYVQAWKSGDPRVHNTQVSLPASRGLVSGMPTLVKIDTHPECGCSLSA